MGVVWRATDTTLGRQVAIKVLPTEFASDPERMARFEREARVLASLNHPGIAAVYGVGSADGVRFLAMELVEGEDLAARIERGPLPLVEALEVGRQIAEALEAAHEKGIVHRDLKPANVKLTEEGQVKVLDFGLAKAAEARSPGPTSTPTILPTVTSAGTAMGMILGTAAYMSPEQARGKTVDRRADIWALGCVLYECLTGHRAFEGETASDTLAKILEREPSFAALPASTPPRVRELLQRCLIKDPKLRLRDIGDARITLDEALASRTPSGQLAAVAAPVAEGRPIRRTSPMLLAAVAAAALIAGAGGWAMLGARSGGGVKGVECVTISIPPEVSVPTPPYAFSSDGRTVVVMGRPRNADSTIAGPPRLYTRRLDQYEFHELAGTEGATGFGAVVNNEVMYGAPSSAGSSQFRLWRIPVDGSAPPTAVVDADPAWTALTATPDGDVLAVRENSELVRYPHNGGARSAPVKMDAGRPGVSTYALFGTLPGNGGVLTDVVVYDARGWHYSVGVTDPATGKVKIVVEDGGTAAYSPTGHLVFARGSTLLAMPFDAKTATPLGTPVAVWSGLSTPFAFLPSFFALSETGLLYRPGQVGGIRRMAFVDATGRVTGWDGEPRGVDTGPEPSPDGRRFACSIPNDRGIDEVFVADLDRPGYRRVTDDPNADCATALWSPDGRRLAYSRHGRDARDGIYVVSADGGDARRIYAPRSDQERSAPYAWLPDGSALLLAVNTPGNALLALLTVAGDAADASRLRTLVSSTNMLDQPRISPEGRRIAYQSDESGKLQVYVAELRPDRTLGHPVQVRTAGGREARWSRDGKWLFVRDDRRHVVRVAVGAPPELTLSTPENVLDLGQAGVTLWSVLPDGGFFVGLKSDDEGDVGRLNLVLGWGDELKKRLRAKAP